MKIRLAIKTASIIAALALALISGSAFAHSFNVALVLPVADPAKAQQIRQGFMLATTERDGHPDEESDGHLGGLDVYVRFIDSQKDLTAEWSRVSDRGVIDIVAVFDSPEIRNNVENVISGEMTTLVTPGKNPFMQKEMPAVAGFVSAYEKAYGSPPTGDTAQGYNMARRIGVAVRDQAGTDDRAQLSASFGDTALKIDW